MTRRYLTDRDVTIRLPDKDFRDRVIDAAELDEQEVEAWIIEQLRRGLAESDKRTEDRLKAASAWCGVPDADE